ncbi:virulence factor SrfB [Pseudomonas sp.]|uniref:virulence factor SrfB n=1 Tax=Pseudomonas sp. TaxID=306 RepID=UPI0028B1314F|nr:virulence factor SrfB [Pseudomonas sp.]
MLPELTPFEDTVHLVNDSGLQFLDFAVRLDPGKAPAGRFARMGNTLIARLLLNHDTREYFHLGPVSNNGQTRQNERLVSVVDEEDLALSLQSSLTLLEGLWLPAPYFRFLPPERFDEGPTNWARMRLVRLEQPDVDGNTHRLTLAFDTRAMSSSQGVQYLAPTQDDINAGANFRLACHAQQSRWFLDQQWVRLWLEEIYRDSQKARPQEDIDEELEEQRHLGHYLNLLSLMARPVPEQYSQAPALIPVPDIKLTANGAACLEPAIPVDLVLDVGNSRTCGILIENHGQSGDGLKHNYVLQIRDLTCPERVYSEPFESRVEFAQASFGKENFSVQSGRHDAFQWPTIARVGVEAGRLSGRRKGTEGSTGLSSPKRYLWDENAYLHGWRFNGTSVGSDKESKATAAPFSHCITKLGQAFYKLKNEDDRLPAFAPQYSRSSLMTFMLAEVITQALMQINSPAQRARMGHTQRPRQLSGITLTVPPGMPQVERSLLNDRLLQAIALVWKCMGWHEGDLDPAKARASNDIPLPRIPLPKVRVEWDEATCGQLVYLYTEIRENFAGHPQEFFDTLARPDKTEREAITLASIDIGGGTSDLVITDYSLERATENASGSNVTIIPTQRFRDSFKVAGDDILLDVIQRFVLPGLEQAFAAAGVQAPRALLSKLCGEETSTTQDTVLRQQLNLQVFVPLGLYLLGQYERFDPEFPTAPYSLSYREVLALSQGAITQQVQDYVASGVRRADGGPPRYDLEQVLLQVDLGAIHQAFLKGQINLCKILDALAEVVFHYPCDALLITGRPSRLPGVLSFLRRKVPLPPGRIVPMDGYRVGGWYPFHRNGRIDDPKTTAAVGAMLCLLSAQRNVSNFYLSVARLKPYSTMRHIGKLDENNLIIDHDVFYRDVIRSDANGNETLQLHDPSEEGPRLRVLGKIRLGYRQLLAQRWVASPLYVLELTASGSRKLADKRTTDGLEPCLLVRLKVESADSERGEAEIIAEKLLIDENIESNVEGESFTRKDVRLQLYTMLSAEGGASDYWLDSGSVSPK